MKRLAAFLLAFLMCLSLCACGKQTEEKPAAEEQAAGDSPAPDYLCCTREASRLYAVPLDNSAPQLLLDEACYAYQRADNTVVAAFGDGTVRRFDLTTGKEETLFTFTDDTLDMIGLYSGGFIYVSYSMTEGSSVFKYDNKTKEAEPLFDDPNFWNYVIIDDVVYYTTYGAEEDYCPSQLAAYDLCKDTELWRVETLNGSGLVARGDTLYISEGEETYRWFTVNLQDGSRTTTGDISAEIVGSDIKLACSGGVLAELYEEPATEDDWGVWWPYFVTADGQKNRLDIPMSDSSYAVVQDHEGDYALMQIGGEDVTYTIFGEEEIWNPDRWYLFDGADGKLTELTAMDETESLFVDGDFPVFDCSTARKPVVHSIYELFCMNTGIDGASPVCNTTHGAWTAIADRTSDIALLAAPTEEEQAYLEEQGVEVEMKLYGGDGLVFIGNKACGVENLTLEQVKAIYRGEITNWAELGGVDHAIRVLYRDDQSGSQRLFENLVWKGEDIPDFASLGFAQTDEMSTIVNECLYDPYTIGYSIMTYLNDVFSEEELQCFSLNDVAATPDNVKTGDYPLGTRGYVVIRADEPEDSGARRLYDWFGCPIADQILTINGITPMSE